MHKWIFGSIAIVGALSAASGQSTRPDSNKIELTYSLSAPEMYKTWCATCHGTTGKGDGPAASALRKAPADLTQLTKKNKGKFPTERVRDFIEGKNSIPAHGSREMPMWGEVFQRIADEPAAVSYRVTALSSYIEGMQAK